MGGRTGPSLASANTSDVKAKAIAFVSVFQKRFQNGPIQLLYCLCQQNFTVSLNQKHLSKRKDWQSKHTASFREKQQKKQRFRKKSLHRTGQPPIVVKVIGRGKDPPPTPQIESFRTMTVDIMITVWRQGGCFQPEIKVKQQ